MFISTIHSIDNLEKLKNSGVDAVIVGILHFSIRHTIEVGLDKLPSLKEKCNELGLKLYVNFLRMCMEEDMEEVARILSIFKELDIDGVYYSDEGVLYEALQIGFESKLIYQPETLVASSSDVKFYLQQGIQSVSLAHELSLEEIKSIASKCNNIEILAFGYFSIMYSRRPLITNYLEAVNVDYDGFKKTFELIEQTREERMPIYQDENGTHVFCATPISSFNEFKTLKECGIDRFRIDSIFFNDDVTCLIVDAYKKGKYIELGTNRWYYEETIKKKEGQ